MSGPLGHNHTFTAHASKRFGCGQYQRWVGVDCIAGDVVDQIGLKDDSLALNANPKEPKTGGEDLVNPLRILLDVQDRDS